MLVNQNWWITLITLSLWVRAKEAKKDATTLWLSHEENSFSSIYFQSYITFFLPPYYSVLYYVRRSMVQEMIDSSRPQGEAEWFCSKVARIWQFHGMLNGFRPKGREKIIYFI